MALAFGTTGKWSFCYVEIAKFSHPIWNLNYRSVRIMMAMSRSASVRQQRHGVDDKTVTATPTQIFNFIFLWRDNYHIVQRKKKKTHTLKTIYLHWGEWVCVKEREAVETVSKTFRTLYRNWLKNEQNPYIHRTLKKQRQRQQQQQHQNQTHRTTISTIKQCNNEIHIRYGW